MVKPNLLPGDNLVSYKSMLLGHNLAYEIVSVYRNQVKVRRMRALNLNNDYFAKYVPAGEPIEVSKLELHREIFHRNVILYPSDKE